MKKVGALLSIFALLVFASATANAESRYETTRSGGIDAAGSNGDSNLTGYRSSRFDQLASLTAPNLDELHEKVDTLRTTVNNNYTNLHGLVSDAQSTADSAQATASTAKSRADSAYSRADSAYSLARSANSRASSAYSLASKSKVVATTKWRTGRYESTVGASASTSCRAPSGTRYLTRVWMDSGYGGRDGNDSYFWLCFYTN